MDRTVTSTEANQRFSQLLREVRAGNSITITSRGEPVAQIGPPKQRERPTREDMQQLWEAMDSMPRLVSGPWTRDELYDR